MKEFSIIHLSDLHINNNKKLQEIYTNLIKDCKKQQEELALKNILIVITGDIVNKGSLEAFERNAQIFIDTLNIELGLSLQGFSPNILLIPGNHDIQRDIYVKTILYAINNNENSNELKIDDSFYSKRWNFVKAPFDNFSKFYKQKIDSNIGETECTYGINAFIFDDCHVCFIRINTSWACTGDQDKSSLRIGKWQLEQLNEQLISKRKELNISEFDLTVATMHHPITWLNEDEQTVLREYLSSEQKFNTNILLHGHVHKGEVGHVFNIDSSLLTLVTGIGWDASDKDFYDKKTCRYSIYKFDLTNNYVDIWMRITNDKSIFIQDNGIYNNLKDGHFKCSIKMNMFGSDNYIGLPSVFPEKIYPINIKKEMLEAIKENSALLIQFKTKLIQEVQAQSPKFFNSIIEKNYFSIKLNKKDTYDLKRKKVVAAFKKNILNCGSDINDFIASGNTLETLKDRKEGEIYSDIELKVLAYEIIIYEFLMYLKKICTHTHKVIFSQKLEEESIEPVIRTHFRIADKVAKSYKKIVAQCGINKSYIDDMSDICWENGSMIYHVIEKGCSLVKSANPQHAHQKSKNDNKWIDYITIPIKEFTFYCENSRKQLPWLTMGISIADEKYVKSLYALNYLEVENCLEDCLKLFSNEYGIAMSEIINCYKEMSKIMLMK